MAADQNEDLIVVEPTILEPPIIMPVFVGE